jgi:mono/diheme cytochrome c family protein
MVGFLRYLFLNRRWGFLLCAAVFAPPGSPAQAEADVARGEQLFTALCAAYCHSRDPGKREAPYLFDCSWIHGGSEQEIFNTISTGVPETRMVPFGGKLPNGDDDILNLVAFLEANSRCDK